ncbi:MAG: (2Fe-2S) ferredoxin domain-containing protein [Elusimicrobiota bacterium]
MPKLKPDDLEMIREKMRPTVVLREGTAKAKITVHMGTCGIARGARKISSAFLSLIEEKKITDVILTTSGCAGLCSKEPMATVELKGEAPVKYIELTEEKAKRIFNEHVLGKKIVQEYALAIGSERVG